MQLLHCWPDLTDNVVSLAANLIPKDDAPFLQSPYVIDGAAETNLRGISRCVPGSFGGRRSQLSRFHHRNGGRERSKMDWRTRRIHSESLQWKEKTCWRLFFSTVRRRQILNSVAGFLDGCINFDRFRAVAIHTPFDGRALIKNTFFCNWKLHLLAIILLHFESAGWVLLLSTHAYVEGHLALNLFWQNDCSRGELYLFNKKKDIVYYVEGVKLKTDFCPLLSTSSELTKQARTL